MGAAAISPRACTPEFVFSFRSASASGTCVYSRRDSSLLPPFREYRREYRRGGQTNAVLDLNRRDVFFFSDYMFFIEKRRVR